MKSVRVGAEEFRYVVYVPPAYDPGNPMPAVVFLNGQGECGTDGLKQTGVGLGAAVMADVERWPFVIAFAQKQVNPALWETEDAMVMAVLDAIKRDYAVDDTRVYLTGLSQGGNGTWSIAARHPELFAAIAPVCGWGEKWMAEKLVGMPIWLFHGDQDKAVDMDCAREMERYVREAGWSCKVTIYEGVAHNCWDRAYREEPLAEWFLEHRKY